MAELATDSYTYASTRDILGTIAAATGTYSIKALLSNSYTYDEDHEFADDITGELSGGSYARVTVSGFTRTVVDGVSRYTLDDSTFTGITASGITHAILVQWKGTDGTSPVVGCLKFSPQNVTAEDFVVAWGDPFIEVGDARDTITSVAGVEPDSTGDIPVADLADAITVEIEGGVIPDATDGTEGQVWTTDGAAASWEDPDNRHTVGALVCVDTDYGDPTDTPVALLDGTTAYFFARDEGGEVDEWEYAGLYYGTAPDLETPSNPVRAPEALQPRGGSALITRDMINLQDVEDSEWQYHTVPADKPMAVMRVAYISSVAGVNKPVQSVLMEYGQPGVSLPGTTDETFPVLGAKFTGNLSALTDSSQLSDALQAFDDYSGGGGGGSVATDAIFDAKGDLAVGTGSNTAAKLTVGANDTFLIAASGETTGAKWAGGSTARTALGLGTSATLNTGTTAGTVAAGDHTHTGQAVAGQDEGAAVADTVGETSLLDSAPTVTATAGEFLKVTCGGTYTNDSGSSRAPTFRIKLDGTTVLSWSSSVSANATARDWHMHATFRVQASGDVNGSGTLQLFNLDIAPSVGTSSAAIQSGVALDVTVQHPTATTLQTCTLAYIAVERVRSSIS